MYIFGYSAYITHTARLWNYWPSYYSDVNLKLDNIITTRDCVFKTGYPSD